LCALLICTDSCFRAISRLVHISQNTGISAHCSVSCRSTLNIPLFLKILYWCALLSAINMNTMNTITRNATEVVLALGDDSRVDVSFLK
jgi:hypothetical protein